MSRTSPSSQTNDGGTARRRPARGRSLAAPIGTVLLPPKRVKGVGRHAARHYDPTTGRRRTT